MDAIEMSGAVDLGQDDARRFGGMARLHGVEAATKLRQSHVVIIGLGGVGSWVAEALARSGVSKLTLIDMDHVAESNVNRQAQALSSTLGQAKVQAMAERISLINAGCTVRGIEEFVTPENWMELLPSDAHAVVDACDQVRVKTALAVWARASNVCFLTVGAAGGKRQAQLVAIDDLADCTHDPLLAQLRYRLRKSHGAPRSAKLGVWAVYSKEAVQQAHESCNIADASSDLNCHGYGSSVAVTATFGFCAAGWVMNQLATA